MQKGNREMLKGLMVFFLIVGLALGTCTAVQAQGGKLSISRMTVSGGTIGGTSNLMANGLAAVGYRYCGIQGTVITNATMTQVQVVQNKEADISTVVGYQAYDAYHGKWKQKPFPECRILFQGNKTAWHIAVLEKSPITTLKDLKGKKVVTGKRGFLSDDVTKKVIEALGLEYGKDFKPVYLGHADAMAALINGTVDAYIVVSDPPQPTFVQLTQSHRCRIVGVTPDEMKIVSKEHPYIISTTIAAGTYRGMEKDVLAPVSWMFYGLRNDFPEDAAYCVTKAFWEHQDFAAMQWAALGRYKIEDVANFVTAPYHVGAYRYFKERGLSVSAVMTPAEAK